MFSRALGVPVVLAAAVGVPYVANNGTADLEKYWSGNASATATETQQAQQSPVAMPQFKQLPEHFTASPQGSKKSPIYKTVTPLEGNRSMSLVDIFRFDVNKEWVYQHWARKSTALAELGLYGIRVPLVSGTKLHDLAGSLTYYFDNAGRVERISFRGNTGDTTQLVMLMNKRYGLQPQATAIAGEQLYQVKNGTAIYSELRTRPAAVLWANSPHDSFSVELELQNPAVQKPLPSKELPMPEAQKQAPTEQKANSTDKQGKDPKGENEDSWDNYFPRSRVPKNQVENLDKHYRYW